MKKLLLLFLLSILTSGSYGQSGTVSFYVVAQPDQWQLFMGINAYNDIVASSLVSGKKVVFIYMTAGDESCNGASLNTPYYQARQQGANTAVEFCADQPGWHYPLTSYNDTSTGHSILRYQYRNVVSYCMKLPGGCDGNGLFGSSLQFLRKASINSIAAVDSSAIYSGWGDLARTISTIMSNEYGGYKDFMLNTADTDLVINAGEHPDNINAAYLALEAMATIPHAQIHLFREYVTATLPVNMNDKDIATEAALLSLLDGSRTENDQPSEWDAKHISYTSRNYYRTIKK